ncbi:CAP domain-containing protein [Devosia geojensis]|uniref:CAP domain-containing protein n=1 Tax=Devosia geojensis TaxID=443610 RepID=UPI0006987AF1|nr:CAP domain-containing protein [Devosia geojensis]
MTDQTLLRRAIRPLPTLAAAALAALLAACSAFSGGGAPAALPAGLSARMDQPGASLDKAQALGLVNAYRASVGAGALTADAGLEAQAQQLANQYAASGTSPRTPEGVAAMRSSAGYATFAETFSGWRNSSPDAAALATAGARRAGLAVAANPNSAYGVHWVLLLGQ